MAENFIVEKDGRQYVYRSTSVYDAKTHRKRTVTEYIGKIDPDTGDIIKKKSRAKPVQIVPNNGIVRNYGASHALVSLSESCRLREDLHSAFGRDGDCILATAISMILTGGPMYFLEPEIDTNMVRELLGMGGT